MEENIKVASIAIIIIVLIAIAAGVYYFFIYEKPEEILSIQKVQEEQPAQVPAEELVIEEEAPELIQIELDESDDTIRNMAEELSSHPGAASWLMSKDLIRKFVGAVDNIANGLSPRSQIDFFTLEESFKIIEKDGLYYASPEGYIRYNLVGDVFSSLDSEGWVKLYEQSTLLIQEAYKDLGYPEEDFDKTLTAAIVELLKAPVVEKKILLVATVVSYTMADPELENLNEAQKHLIRMGPENVRKIQAKLREIGLALGIPENKLPRARIYSSR
ncbi:MAG TPA: DUF3014 domain-containing protein [Candidatus Aminicenantes bacterium]|nr:DUF3014 domain-containing protein [Candidatus Aminicenantes bacterium]